MCVLYFENAGFIGDCRFRCFLLGLSGTLLRALIFEPNFSKTPTTNQDSPAKDRTIHIAADCTYSGEAPLQEIVKKKADFLLLHRLRVQQRFQLWGDAACGRHCYGITGCRVPVFRSYQEKALVHSYA